MNRTKDEIKDAPEFDQDTYRDESYRSELGGYYAPPSPWRDDLSALDVQSPAPEAPAGTLAAMRLLGVAVPDDDLRRIVSTLLQGDETSRELPGRIAIALDRRVALLALSVDERGALLDVLEERSGPRSPSSAVS